MGQVLKIRTIITNWDITPAGWVAHVTRDFLICYSYSFYVSMPKEIYTYFKFAVFVMYCVNSKMKFNQNFWNAILKSNNSQNWKYYWIFFNFSFLQRNWKIKYTYDFHGFPNLISIYLLFFQMSTEHDKRDVEAH